MDLETSRLRLIELTWDDLERVHELNSYPEVDRFNTLGIPLNLDDTRKAMQDPIEDQFKSSRAKYAWGIWHGDDFVGKIGMNVGPAKYCRAEIYYVFIPRFWGFGYATESASAVVRFGFEELKLHRIEAGVATENFGSIRVLEKIGMTREGIGRKILPIRGEWVDNFSYSILEDDPKPY